MKTTLLTIVAASGLLIAGCTQSNVEQASQEFNALPPAVQKAVRSHAPNAEIASVDRKERDGQSYYVIQFANPGANPELTVAPDGTVIRADADRGVGSRDRAVGLGSPRTAPDATAGRGSRTDAAGERPALAPEGPTGRTAKTDLSALPPAVQKTLQEKAPNAEITGINREEENGRIVYAFEFADEGKNPTLRIAEDGTVVQTLQK